MTTPAGGAAPRAPLRRPRLVEYVTRPWLVEYVVLGVIGLIAAVAAITGDRSVVPDAEVATVLDGWLPGLYLALAVSVGGVVLARRHPWPGLVLVAAAPLVSALMQWDPIATWNIAVFATFWLTLRSLPGLPAGLLVGAANFAAAALAQGGFSLERATPSIAAFAALAAAGAGSAIRGHRRYWAELEARTGEAEATRDAEARRRVAQERVRIARDLHDVVGHEVALVSMHLGAAEVHLPAGADAARADLAAVRGGVRAVLAGTQRILRVLRTEPDDEPTAPAAGYEHIADLVAASRAAGLDVEATVGEPAATLGPAVSAAAYRIVQEALTNAGRHGTGSVSLAVAADDEAVTIETVNVRAPAADGAGRGGYGLVGMRERAASVGGWIDTASDGTLFWLWAHLPVDEGNRQ